MELQALKQYLSELLEAGLILTLKSPSVKPIGTGEKRITLGSTSPSSKTIPDNSVDSYFSDLSNGNYGLILKDGGLIQIDYVLKKKKIIRHRYCYVPAPFEIPSDLVDGDIEEFLSLFSPSIANTLLKSRIRFDFEKGVSNNDHPESHLTLNSTDCRLAVRNGLGVRSFFRFIVGNFVDRAELSQRPLLYTNDYVKGPGPSATWRPDLHLTWV